MLMIALGCGFFTGFRTVAPAMQGAASDYVRESSLMDLRLRSNIGVKSDEIAAVRSAEGVRGAFAGYTKELCWSSDPSVIIKAFSLPGNISPDSANFLNRPYVLEGRLPQSKDECAVELRVTSPKEFAVGGEISLVSPDPEGDPLENTLSRDSFRIVGVVISPMFLGYERDNASIGDGLINSNIYIPEADFTCDYYTDMFVKLEIDDAIDPFSAEYRQAVDERGAAAKQAFEDSERNRYEKLKTQARDKIDSAEESIARAEDILSADRPELERRLAEARKLAEETEKKYGGVAGIFAKAAVARANLQVRTLESLLDDESGEVRGELEGELAQARLDLAEGKEQLAAAPELKIYRDDRFSFSDYESFYSDTEKTARLAQAFPPFFALTAALVCLTGLSRMVEEQRTTIGAYRSLGYSGGAVLARFLIYGTAAALVGSLGGSAVGMAVLPGIVMNMYTVLYSIPLDRSAFRNDYLVLSAAVSVLLVWLAAGCSCRRELSAKTAELLRPRAPESGRRTLLERAGFIWDRMGFISKVTARNIFRYKKRALMTIAGVAGCCALIIAGFGMRFSIASILDRQFGDIFLFGGIAAVESPEQAAALGRCEGVKCSVPIVLKQMSAGSAEKKLGTYVLAPDGSLDGYIDLRERVSGKKLSPEGGAVVTEKLADLCGLAVGGCVEIRTPEGENVPVDIVGIAENYSMNFVYVDKAVYGERFGGFEVNSALVNAEEGIDQAELSRRLIAENATLGVSWLDDMRASFAERTVVLDGVVLVLILCAMMLAATVLFDLADININERERELASLKVLGFYDSETAAYIFRETFLLTLIGLLPGAVLGRLLHGYLISAVEVDLLMFVRGLFPQAYLYGALLTVLFSLLVSGALYFKLIKIDPAVSLKSVE